ncbi:MAG: SLC13 family permease [Candidatus Eisenbacteria bacterium]
MTIEIGILFAVLAAMAYLFFTEKLPVDLTAFLGLLIFTLIGYVNPAEAFTGFSSPAVITMLSVFFLSASMIHTGLADMIGARVHRWFGSREVPLLIAIMVVSGVLSAFMNNIAAAAVLMPAVGSIARKSGSSPSRLFMPLAFASVLGGTLTLVGTPPNILASDMLRERGYAPFSLFDFTAIGAILLGLGILYLSTVGRRLLPTRAISDSVVRKGDLAQVYRLHETLFSIRIPCGSRLDGLTLGETKIGTALGVQVVGILRGGRKELAPEAKTLLLGGDVLLVKGRYEDLQELFRFQGVEIGEARPGDLAKASGRVTCIAARVLPGSPFAARTLRGIKFRDNYGAIAIGIRREGEILDRDLPTHRLREGDQILALGTQSELELLAQQKGLEIAEVGDSLFQEMSGHLFILRVPERSALVGSTIGRSRLGELVGLTVAGICRGEEMFLAAGPDETILAGDELLVAGEPERIRSLLALGEVQLQQDAKETGLESEDVGVVEVTVAPRSRAAGRTLAEMHFREKHGLQVLAVWREGNAIHANLAGLPLRFGDALLIQGPWNRIRLLGADPDFVTLSLAAQEKRRTKKTAVALGGLLILVAMVVSGFQPIHVAAFAAAAFVALGGAITMEEAYRAVEWRAVFLVAAILPVGIAMERTGAALLLSQSVIALAGPAGPIAVLAALCCLSSLLSQCLDGAPTVVLLAPVVVQTAEQLGLSPHFLMMGVGLAASAAFMTPFSHKANLLVMGAGGYRVSDYLRVGTPLTIFYLAVVIALVPVFFPIHP